MNTFNSLSLLLLTKNEEKNIKEFLFSWIKKCPCIDEIILIDDDSTDSTVKLIQSLKSKTLDIKVVRHSLQNDFSSQRTLGPKTAKNDWILWLDADESPSPEMIAFLNNFKPQPNTAYSFPRLDTFLGQKLHHGENGNLKFVRLFNKNHGHFTGKVHEVWVTDHKIHHQNLSIYHRPHASLKSLIQKINYYSDIRSQELFDRGVTTNLFEIIFFPFGKFITNYFFKLGFLDGTAGIVMALSMSFHSFLVRGKLWQLSLNSSSS